MLLNKETNKNPSLLQNLCKVESLSYRVFESWLTQYLLSIYGIPGILSPGDRDKECPKQNSYVHEVRVLVGEIKGTWYSGQVGMKKMAAEPHLDE
jgi:hypothetical protein